MLECDVAIGGVYVRLSVTSQYGYWVEIKCSYDHAFFSTE